MSIPIDTASGYSTAEAAKLVGVAKRTLLRWIYSGRLRGPRKVKIGGAAWRVWTDAHIETARKVKASLKPGPKAKTKKKPA